MKLRRIILLSLATLIIVVVPAIYIVNNRYEAITASDAYIEKARIETLANDSVKRDTELARNGYDSDTSTVEERLRFVWSTSIYGEKIIKYNHAEVEKMVLEVAPLLAIDPATGRLQLKRLMK